MGWGRKWSSGQLSCAVLNRMTTSKLILYATARSSPFSQADCSWLTGLFEPCGGILKSTFTLECLCILKVIVTLLRYSSWSCEKTTSSPTLHAPKDHQYKHWVLAAHISGRTHYDNLCYFSDAGVLHDLQANSQCLMPTSLTRIFAHVLLQWAGLEKRQHIVTTRRIHYFLMFRKSVW